MAIISCKEPNG